MTTITKSIANDFGGLLNLGQFQEQILDSAITDVEARFNGININGDTMDIIFNDTLTGGEIAIIEDIITNYVYQAPQPDSQIVPIYIDGDLEPALIQATFTGTTSGGNVVFDAINNYSSEPLFESIIASTAHLTSFSTSETFVYGTPTLAGNKETITVPIRVQTTSSVVILGISVLNGTGFSNPTNGTTVHMTIFGRAYED